MSEGGRGMMANFLKMKGGHWGGENEWCGVVIKEGSKSVNGVKEGKLTNGATTKGHSALSAPPIGAPSMPTILNRIQAQRMLDIEASSSAPSTTQANLTTSLSLHTSPPLISFVNRIVSTPHTAVMAEIKRASPSKGDIAPLASAPAQAVVYALAGASVISVLTEPKWFKGNLVDMLAVRQAVGSLPNRPAILRKDFILSTYQIDEARLYGADTVLLIVAMLEQNLLVELYQYSLSLGMEPLVEVNNPEELKRALEIGAKVIGVNNRNLHDFKVDMSTTSRVNAALKGEKSHPLRSVRNILPVRRGEVCQRGCSGGARWGSPDASKRYEILPPRPCRPTGSASATSRTRPTTDGQDLRLSDGRRCPTRSGSRRRYGRHDPRPWYQTPRPCVNCC